MIEVNNKDGWVTDRPPSNVSGQVWVSVDGIVVQLSATYARRDWDNGFGKPWKPIETPDPYVPPWPVRREYLMNREPGYLHKDDSITMVTNAVLCEVPSGCPLRFGGIHLREVLPGDLDPDKTNELLDCLVSMCEEAIFTQSHEVIKRIHRARNVTN